MPVWPPRFPARRWEQVYRRRLMVSDTLSVLVAVFGSQWIRFGTEAESLAIDPDPRYIAFTISYTVFSVVLALVWLFALSLFGTRRASIIGTGTVEYKQIVDATIRVFGVLAIICYLGKVELGRGYFLLALPFGLLLLLGTRWAWRTWVGYKRKSGWYFNRTLLIGEQHQTQHVAAQILRAPASGLAPVAAITSDGLGQQNIAPGIAVAGGLDDIERVLDEEAIETVVYTGSDQMSPDALRQLGWQLESRGIHLVVAPALTDIAGPRIRARPVAGLPLISVDIPEFEGRKYSSKRALDILGSGFGILLLSPIFLLFAILIKRDSRGPVFFRQKRVGLNGRDFYMVKFRSMVVDAEDRLDALRHQSQGNEILFKMKSDPRITKLGAFMRRYSIDELPQLINVFRGDMSLVGPRPPLRSEVDQYEDAAHRRFLVKPGMTGLWQVSGRSDLSWEDSLRLDLYYVENWSMTGDFIILWRTVRAVMGSSGAY
ncbi:sugar transferase [Mycetocola lacteus]|uniref:Sugar transferase n=2 Tax=Mycetocola lacteus TaxID=76637 RepID=A0A3L7AVY2_9MICO|nr:sugar transferase [Mycetocola lacteus]